MGSRRIGVGQVTLTDAQIKALPTTAITIVAAPPAGYMHYMLASILDLNSAAGAYTNISDGGSLTFETNGNGWGQTLSNQNDVGATLLSDFMGVASRRWVMLGMNYEDILINYGTIPYSRSTVSGEAGPITIRGYNGGGNFTGGNVANRMRATALYITMATL